MRNPQINTYSKLWIYHLGWKYAFMGSKYILYLYLEGVEMVKSQFFTNWQRWFVDAFCCLLCYGSLYVLASESMYFLNPIPAIIKSQRKPRPRTECLQIGLISKLIERLARKKTIIVVVVRLGSWATRSMEWRVAFPHLWIDIWADTMMGRWSIITGAIISIKWGGYKFVVKEANLML